MSGSPRPWSERQRFQGVADALDLVPAGSVAAIDPNAVHYRQVVLTGSANSRRRDYDTALRLIEGGHIDTAAMVTHRFGLPDVLDALGKVGADDAIKVAVLP